MTDSMKRDFMRLLVSKPDEYFISLKMICGWIEEPYTYWRYTHDSVYKKYYDDNFLQCPDCVMSVAINQNDIGKDYLFLMNDNGIDCPWFSLGGFKSICIIIDDPHTIFIKNVFNLVEITQKHIVYNYADTDISNRMRTFRNLFYKVILEHDDPER